MQAALRSIAALLLGVAILVAGNGLLGMLVPVRAGLEDFATTAIGLLSSAFSLGYVFSCYCTPVMVQRVGHIRTFAVLAALGSSMVLLMGLFVHPVTWIVIRVIGGFCMAGLYMVIESWLSERSSNENRGQIFAVYMMINLFAAMAGQLSLPLGDPSSHVLFVVTGIAILLALVPVSLTTSAAPAPIVNVKLRLMRLYRMSPVGIVGCFFVGMANGAYSGLGAVYAHQAGFTMFQVALFMSASLVGGVLAQVPIGRVSDRVDRRGVIVAVCACAILVALPLAMAGGINGGVSLEFSPMSLIILSGVIGCFIYTMYALCVANTNDQISPEDFVEASSALLLMYGLGATLGPFLAAMLMQTVGAGALFVFTTAVHLLLMIFVLHRMSVRETVPPEERELFIQTAAQRSTPAAIAMDPRASHEDEPEHMELMEERV